MTTYRGRVDCYLEPAVADGASVHSRANGEFFVNLVQHVSASMPDLGIEMLGWSYGNGGAGWNFWDQPGSTGHFAFAAFRFHSASLGKFDCLIYAATGSYTDHTGSMYINNGNTSGDPSNCFNQVGIAFACHPSSSVIGYQDTSGPWNGGLGEGAWIPDASPIWKADVNSKGAFFPRPNDQGGDHITNKDFLQGLGGYQMNSSRNHFILSEDSITILTDSQYTGKYRIMHFGPYLPRSGVIADSPYVMWSSGNEDNYEPWVHFYGGQIGNTSRAPESNNDIYQGGAAHPNLLTGSRRFSWGSWSVGNTIGQNKFINSGTIEKFPVWVIIHEGDERNYAGVLKHLAHGYTNNMTVSSLSSSAAFGRMSFAESKVFVPWNGNPPNQGFDRTGRNFSIG